MSDLKCPYTSPRTVYSVLIEFNRHKRQLEGSSKDLVKALKPMLWDSLPLEENKLPQFLKDKGLGEIEDEARQALREMVSGGHIRLLPHHGSSRWSVADTAAVA